jgi:hypothetical protein
MMFNLLFQVPVPKMSRTFEVRQSYHVCWITPERTSQIGKVEEDGCNIFRPQANARNGPVYHTGTSLCV